MGSVDLLDTLRAFGRLNINTEEEFVELWMDYGNAQARFHVFYELDEWCSQYKYKVRDLRLDWSAHHAVGFGARVRERPPTLQDIRRGR